MATPKDATTKYCRRCGGSGHHSYCSYYGTRCFQCHGSGVLPLSESERKRVQQCACGAYFFRTRQNKTACKKCQPPTPQPAPQAAEPMPYEQKPIHQMTAEEQKAHLAAVAATDWEDWPF